LADLSTEYKLARIEASQAWSGIWRDFSEQRNRCSEIKQQFEIMDSEIKRQARSIEELSAGLERKSGDDEFVLSLRAALAVMKTPLTSRKTFNQVWWPVPWVLLPVNLCAYTVYVRYLFAGFKSLILRHTFITVASILIAVVASRIPQLSWAVVASSSCG
jgi:hypothetical protein